MQRPLMFSDFPLETQELFKEFGIAEGTNISQDFEKFLKKDNIDIIKYVNRVDTYVKKLEIEEELNHCVKKHRKNIFNDKFSYEKNVICSSDLSKLVA